VQHIHALCAGQVVAVPTYDFATHTRTPITHNVQPAPVILIEGILIFVEKPLCDLMDMRIFVDTDADLRFIRRLHRDMEERGRTLDSVVAQYLTTVRPMHIEFVEPSKRNAHVIVPEGGENRVAMQMIVSHIRMVLGFGF
jgi:uridine kinase